MRLIFNVLALSLENPEVIHGNTLLCCLQTGTFKAVVDVHNKVSTTITVPYQMIISLPRRTDAKAPGQTIQPAHG